MKIAYQVSKEDYLTLILFNASQSKLSNKRKYIVWFGIPIVYVLFGVLTMRTGYSIPFFCISAIWLVGYPFYRKWKHKRFYSKHVDEKFASKMNRDIEVEFLDDALSFSDDISNGTIKKEAFEEVVQLPNHLILKISTGDKMIIPKNQIDVGEVISCIENMLVPVNNKHKDWKW